jgi:uncharacterized protein (DUF1501 family)
VQTATAGLGAPCATPRFPRHATALGARWTDEVLWTVNDLAYTLRPNAASAGDTGTSVAGRQ